MLTMSAFCRSRHVQFVRLFSALKSCRRQVLCKTCSFLRCQDTKLQPARRFPAVALGFTLPSFFGLFGKKEEKEEDPVIMSMKKAKLSQMREDLVGAERYYHEALAHVNQKRAANSITEKDFLFAVTNINDCLAELALVQGQLDTADRLYKEVMKGCLQIGLEQTDNAIVELSIKLASIYAMQNKMAEARLGFQHAIQTQEKKIAETENVDENTKALLGIALESFSRFLMMHKEYDNAEKYLKKSYDLAMEVLGEEHPQTLVIMNDLATIDIIKKRYSKAETAVKKAIAVGERVNSPDVASFYCNLGAVHLRQDLHLEAKAVCTKAMSMAMKAGDDAAKAHAERCLKKVKEVEEKKQKQKAS